MAARNVGDPQVTGYWWKPSVRARLAASTTSGGGSKSGKPWARLMAPCSSARRVISRITDSVNRDTRAEVRTEEVAPAGELAETVEGSMAWSISTPRDLPG